MRSAKAAEFGRERAHRGGAARQFRGRISNRPKDTLDLTMEIIWSQRKVLALDEGVFLIKEEALIERIYYQHHEAGARARHWLT